MVRPVEAPELAQMPLRKSQSEESEGREELRAFGENVEASQPAAAQFEQGDAGGMPTPTPIDRSIGLFLFLFFELPPFFCGLLPGVQDMLPYV